MSRVLDLVATSVDIHWQAGKFTLPRSGLQRIPLLLLRALIPCRVICVSHLPLARGTVKLCSVVHREILAEFQPRDISSVV